LEVLIKTRGFFPSDPDVHLHQKLSAFYIQAILS
jgi:hypothetical protein